MSPLNPYLKTRLYVNAEVKLTYNLKMLHKLRIAKYNLKNAISLRTDDLKLQF